MTNDPICLRPSTLNQFLVTTSLIETGRSPDRMADPLLSQQTTERGKKKREKRETDVPEEPQHPMDQALFVLVVA